MADGKRMEARRPTAPPPSCVLCRAFRATWNPQHPRECTAYGFRSQEYPSAVVQRLSGRPCDLFAPRAPVRDGRSKSR